MKKEEIIISPKGAGERFSTPQTISQEYTFGQASRRKKLAETISNWTTIFTYIAYAELIASGLLTIGDPSVASFATTIVLGGALTIGRIGIEGSSNEARIMDNAVKEMNRANASSAVVTRSR